MFDRYIKQSKPLTPENEELLGVSNDNLLKGDSLKTVLLDFQHFLGKRTVVESGLTRRFDFVRYQGYRNKIFFSNELVDIYEENAINRRIKTYDMASGKANDSPYLDVMRIVEKAYIRGNYYDGVNTYLVESVGGRRMKVGHGDLREITPHILYNRCELQAEGVLEDLSDPSSELYKELTAEKLIYRLVDPFKERSYLFSSTDKKNDPVFSGQFAIMADPDLAKIYKELGLEGFVGWRYDILETFAYSVKDDVVEDYLTIYKHQGFVF